jgi:hypothetical protein
LIWTIGEVFLIRKLSDDNIDFLKVVITFCVKLHELFGKYFLPVKSSDYSEILKLVGIFWVKLYGYFGKYFLIRQWRRIYKHFIRRFVAKSKIIWKYLIKVSLENEIECASISSENLFQNQEEYESI